MWLNQIWFLLIAVLWTGFFVLEGFDFGVGALLRTVGQDNVGRRVLINTIGPVWDGNEVWVITAIGATFAAFPQWYATLLSGFYPVFLLILICLIVRGVAFEYRAKGTSAAWRRNWDRVIQTSSILLPLLFGLVFGNIVRGVPIDAHQEYAGDLWTLINPFALLTAITLLLLCLTHGAVFLALKTKGAIRDTARGSAGRTGAITLVALLGLVVWQTVIRGNLVSAIVGVLSVAALAAGLSFTRGGRDGRAFIGTAASMLTLAAGWFVCLHPDVMPSTISPAYSLTVSNAASGSYALGVMSWVALFVVPFILAYQTWTYWVFRRRISTAMIPPTPIHSAPVRIRVARRR